jgi:hypothetical protein
VEVGVKEDEEENVPAESNDVLRGEVRFGRAGL